MFDFINQLQEASWNIEIWGNSVFEYGTALTFFVLFLIVFKIFQVIILKKLKKLSEKTETDIDDALIKAIKSLKPPFYYFISLYFILPFLEIATNVLNIVKAVLLVLIVYQVIKAVLIVVDYIFEKLSEKKEDASEKMAYSYMGMFTKIMIWVLGILMILSNLGINITTLIAGLGIGGLAFAFAFKEILSDLFASFVIFFDKPFVIGDFIQMGDIVGEVKKIGIKTTRIKSLTGEEIVVSNQELTSARIRNYQKLKERRISFSFGIIYETPTEKIKQIPIWVQQIISGIKGVRFDRAHFNRFEDSSLAFDVVYYIESQNYAEYMKAQQEINLKILEKFQEKGIEMAYPTRVVYQK